jgi:SAM-dependent MidA family methyltransferase
MTVARFMALALTHPAHGYYTTGDPFGAGGDFVTAPEISQMFGELIGLWAADTWTRMGAPDRLQIVELGPGRGTLMADALRAARALPPFFEAIQVELVEVSPRLADAQRRTLRECGRPISWRPSLDEVPAAPAIIIANEFFDALPIHQFVRTPDGWRERLVGLGPEGALVFGLAPDPDRRDFGPAPNGAIAELAEHAGRVARTIGQRVVDHGGAALVIDYGHVRPGFGDTLQGVRSHNFADPLARPGETDITAHVDFSALGRAAASAGARIHGPSVRAPSSRLSGSRHGPNG